MKTIGLLGGMSWESTALYYRLINEGLYCLVQVLTRSGQSRPSVYSSSSLKAAIPISSWRGTSGRFLSG
jgi:aspartate/glutamate racemase